jgi:hypothetical protein
MGEISPGELVLHHVFQPRIERRKKHGWDSPSRLLYMAL